MWDKKKKKERRENEEGIKSENQMKGEDEDEEG